MISPSTNREERENYGKVENVKVGKKEAAVM
jgi:hypothetical protein